MRHRAGRPPAAAGRPARGPLRPGLRGLHARLQCGGSGLECLRAPGLARLLRAACRLQERRASDRFQAEKDSINRGLVALTQRLGEGARGVGRRSISGRGSAQQSVVSLRKSFRAEGERSSDSSSGPARGSPPEARLPSGGRRRAQLSSHLSKAPNEDGTRLALDFAGAVPPVNEERAR